MNSLNSIEDLDTTLKCPLCSHTYHNENNIPLIIPCQQNHTICSQCLSSLLAKPGKFHCPLDGTSPIQKGEDKIEFEMNKAFIQKIEDNCQHHPNRKLDLICKQCRCKICLACEKKGEHKGHETILLEEYERKFIMKLEEAQESVAKLNEIQSLKQNVLKSREKELLEILDILINEHIEKINTKKKKMQEEIKRFFDSLKRDQELGLPCNDNQTIIFSDWKADIGNKINKIKESSPFNEVSFKFVDEEKILGASEIDNWLKLSRNSLEKFERDLEEVSVKFKIELETTLEEIDILDLKMKVTRKEKGELRDFEISTSSREYDNKEGIWNEIKHKKLRYKEKELSKALEYFRDSIGKKQGIKEEIILEGLALRSVQEDAIQTLYDITRENNKLNLWTRHVKKITLNCFENNDQVMALFKDAFVPLQSLRVLNLDFTRNDQITEKGLSLLGQTISQLFQLTQLELNFSCVANITPNGVEKLALMFLPLRELNQLDISFSGCKALNDELFSKLIVHFPSLNVLQTLTLNFKDVNNLSDKGLSSFHKSLECLTSLKSLDLDFSGNTKITDKGLIDITQALYHLQNLQTIALNFELNKGINDKGLDEIGWALSHLTGLNKINLNFNGTNITTIGFELFIDTLSHLQSLTAVDFNFVKTRITEKSLEKLGATFSLLSNIKQIILNFSWYTIEDKTIDKFTQSLLKLKNLSDLTFELADCRKEVIETLKTKLYAQVPGIKAKVEI